MRSGRGKCFASASAKLSKAGVDATYVEIDTDYGHLAANADAAKWAPALTAFLDRVAR